MYGNELPHFTDLLSIGGDFWVPKPVPMPEIATKRRPGRPRKNLTLEKEITNSLFTTFSTRDSSSESEEDGNIVVDKGDSSIAPVHPADLLLQDNTDTQAIVDKTSDHSTSMGKPANETQEVKDVTATADRVLNNSSSSWASKLKPSAKGMSLSFLKPSSTVINIDMEDIDSEIAFWQFTLVGSFLGTRHSLSSVQNYAKQFWNHIRVPTVLYFKKGWFYFKFDNEADCLNILHGGPWVFGSSTLILKQWTPDFCSHLDTLKVVPVWTLFTDLDPCFWSPSALSKISSSIGKPLFADPYTTDKTRISFARVLIDIDISQDLPSSVTVNTPFGVKEISVEYEWVPYFCKHCNCIGHSTGKCKKNKILAQATNKQVWRPIPKDSSTAIGETIENVSHSIEKVVENKENVSEIQENADHNFSTLSRLEESCVPQEDSTGPAFTPVKGRSNGSKTSSSEDSIPAVIARSPNQFHALALLPDDAYPETEHNENVKASKTEGGRAPHSDPC